jgi:tRNA threonylcarbamoyladenosine biosynthesis protein TsaB
MRILGFDTATLTASVAIVDETGRVIGDAARETPGRSADLLVAIDEVCRAAGVEPRALDAIAVGAGPGSFTGLRIGMATAKGIAFAAHRPLWAVSSLAALAATRGPEERAVPPRSADRAEGNDLVIAALDARRGEVYAAGYRAGVALGAERAMAPAELIAWGASLGEPVRYVGDALAVYPELAPLTDRWRVATPSGAAVARLALAGARVDVLVGGTPSYVRPSEAEVKYPDGVPGALPRR